MEQKQNMITLQDGINAQMPLEMLYMEIGKKEMIIKLLSQRVSALEAQLKEKQE